MEKKHKYISMEEFLIYFDKRHFGMRPYSLELEEYFKMNPLNEDDYKRIKAFLRSHSRYNETCACFGIDTLKLDYKQYAEKCGITERKAREKYSSIGRMPRSLVKALYSLIIQSNTE